MRFQPRKFVRHHLEVPVTFSWKDRKGIRHRHRGATRDISPGGMFLFAPIYPPLGATVGLDAVLPPLSPVAPRWRLVAHGRVVRVEPPPGRKGLGGFAATSEELVVRAN